MKVREVMTKHAAFCGPESSLEEATFLMRRNNCGFLPVIGDGGNVIGVVTDRDMCIALGTRNRKPSDVRVWDVMPRKLFTCMEGDDVHCALKTLRGARIRRLPVIDRDGRLVGVSPSTTSYCMRGNTCSARIFRTKTLKIVTGPFAAARFSPTSVARRRFPPTKRASRYRSSTRFQKYQPQEKGRWNTPLFFVVMAFPLLCCHADLFPAFVLLFFLLLGNGHKLTWSES